MALSLAISTNVFSQTPYIDGGNNNIAIVGADGNVYVCGKNTDGQLGLGNEDDVTSYTKVPYFEENNVAIKEISVGGDYFLAIDYKGNVYEWGIKLWDDTVVTTPQRISVGCMAGTDFDDNGYLTKVISVFSQGSNGYAILSDGRAVSWGYAAGVFYSSGLGCGEDNISSSLPVLITTVDETNNSTPLTAIKQIVASDHSAYLLVDDDNDGYGTVNSFGKNSQGMLGRDPDGTLWKQDNGIDNIARPIMISEKEELSNITSIARTAVSGMALDKDGYVWSWGNDTWGSVCGWASRMDYQTMSWGGVNSVPHPIGIPARVGKGETVGEDNDGTYLLAKNVAGGQDFCTAITKTGNVVSWGGNSPLGNGSIQEAPVAVYVLLEDKNILSQGAIVSCGSNAAYILTLEDELYVFGNNSYGELGLGGDDTKSVMYATKNILPAIPKPMVITSSNVIHTICGHSYGSISFMVSGGREPYFYSWSDGSNEKDRESLPAGTYIVNITDVNGETVEKSFVVEALSSKYNPELALVTVSQESPANLVVWQKEETEAIDFYTIYRETSSAGVYEKLVDVPYTETSIYSDENTNSQIKSYRYKISATDFCGNESPQSPNHKTIHLTINKGLDGINLIWDGYEGFDFSKYLIYRIEKNGTETTVSKIDEVPSTNWTYTDKNATDNTLSYYVAVDLPQTIDVNDPFVKAESGPFVIAISNIAELEQKNAITTIGNNAVVYAKDNAIMVENSKDQNVCVYTVTGQVLTCFKGDGITNVPQKGVYVVVVGSQTYKVFVE